MSEVIDIQDVRYWRDASPKKISAKARDTPFSVASQQSISKDDVHRAILLLEIAAQQARLLVREIADPARRENFGPDRDHRTAASNRTDMASKLRRKNERQIQDTTNPET
jgi:hypothetical protein